uniref:Lipoprotein n=1 Tax=virus sp. ct5rm7 TaxID=2827298 RepID=A0A8S5RH57_9VIRU|nr:MAG TPA: protein of unknown function (DUF4969) [virus sp. ct5rm7]
MKQQLFIVFALLTLLVLTACDSGKRIEGWDTAQWEQLGAPFLKQPKHFLKFSGIYPDGADGNGRIFTFETENHKQSFDYLERCVKRLLKYADAVYDVSDYRRSRSELTIEKLQQYAVDKKYVKMAGSQWAGAYHYDLIFSKDGRYFEFRGGVEVYNVHDRADCVVGFYPLAHL